MSSNQQPTGNDRAAQGAYHFGPDSGSGPFRDSHGVPVAPNQYQPYAQPAGRWEYVPGSPEDAQRYAQATSSTDTSLVLGILSVTVLPLLAPFALWQASKAEKLGGRATAGKVLGWVGLVVLVLGILWLVFILVMWGALVTQVPGVADSSV
ncbi:DUF4190 domain-containing protein [Kocuria sp. BT304]|uniref:DUF4190 domain-containing protein n=1 Tax=Kocuria sp. BT304 TaxID=1702043 RepID=UPI000DD32555|nr:DUF4190 domain-containing protein [Kocuria sp. BT304]